MDSKDWAIITLIGIIMLMLFSSVKGHEIGPEWSGTTHTDGRP